MPGRRCRTTAAGVDSNGTGDHVSDATDTGPQVPHYAVRKLPTATIGFSFLSVFPSTEVLAASLH